MTDTDIAWVAGLLEGEGYFGCRIATTKNRPGKAYLQVRICVNMTDEDVLRRAQSITGAGHINGPYTRTDKR